ncbi:hypothetical protein CGJ15_26305, partial [Vibrio parahaemolyticus]
MSLLTEPIPEKCLHRLTYSTRHSQEVRVSIREWRNEKDSIDKVHLEPTPDKNSNSKASVHSSNMQELPAWRRCINCLCGVSTQNISVSQENPADEETPEERAKKAAEFLEERKPWTNVVD